MGAAQDRAILALMDGIIVGMWRTVGYTQLDPGAILDTPPAALDADTSTPHLARQKG